MTRDKDPLDGIDLPEGLDRADLMALLDQITQGAGVGPFAARRNREIELPDPPIHASLLTVKVSLDGAKPPIWRRLRIRGDLTLDMVHEYLQAAMGWSGSHLHHFEPDRDPRSPRHFLNDFDVEEGEEGTPETDARLDQLLREPGDRLRYRYDFGDDWAHTLLVEEVRPASDDDPPAVCVKAVRECPPEDIGGIWAWNEMAVQEEADLDSINLMLSLVGANPEELLAALEGEFEMPPMHPAYREIVDKAHPSVVPELATLFAAALEYEAPRKEDLLAALHPFQTVLDVAGTDGIRLTKANWMEPAACERIWHESGLAWEISKGTREQHTPGMSRLRQATVRAGLLRSHKGRLVPTKRGLAAGQDPELLAKAIAGSLLSAKEPADQDERVLAALVVASGLEVDPQVLAQETTEGMRRHVRKEAVLDEIARLMTGLGWGVGHGPVLRMHLHEAYDVLGLLSMGEGGPIHLSQLPGPGGRFLAVLALTDDDS
ncbi:IS1096 element passenger TnpR family protein [Actinomycetota bacterium]